MTYTIGDEVTWLYQYATYAPIIPLDAVVVDIGPRRVCIEVVRLNGTTRRTWVGADKLRARQAYTAAGLAAIAEKGRA